jgi:Prealbumin-like fold domain
MSDGTASLARHPMRLAALLVLGLVALSFVSLGRAAPSKLLEIDNNPRERKEKLTMSGSIRRMARHPLRISAMLILGLVALSFVALGQAASPTNFVERDGNVRFNGTGTYDWANGPSPACTFNSTTGVVSCPGTGGLFDGGVYNGQTTPPTPPDPTAALLGDPTIKASTFEVDPLGSDTTSCGKGDPTVYTGQGGEKNGDVINTETFATASVPPKDEISNVYAIAHQTASIDEIFFGVERVVNDGDSHIDLEFLQSSVTVPNACSGTFSGHRSQGDFVASFEFTKGGTLGTPTLHEWMCNTGGPTDPQPPTGTICDKVGDVIDFPSTGGTATGPHYQEVTSGVVADNVKTTVNSGGPIECGGWACRLGSGNTEGLRTDVIATNEFFEGGIDLAGIGFDGCITTFIPHTRSSQSFTATLKDFAIIPFNTCRGSILVKKEDGAGDLLPGAGFTFDPDPFTGGAAIEILDGSTEDKADDNDGWVCIDDVIPDTYDITETTVPDGYAGDPDTETVTVSSGTSSETCAERLAADPLEPDATFTNLLGSILIHKVDGAGNDLAGAGFTFDPDPFTGGAAVEILDGATEDQADDDDGWLCIDNVLLDSYDITETTVPDGYAGDPDTETVTVSSASTCADRLADDPRVPDATFTNLLGSILIHKVDGAGNDLAGAGFTFDPDPFTSGAAVEILDGATEDQADDDDGWLCIDNVVLDTYDITETTVPDGYAGDPDIETVTVSSASTCADRLADDPRVPDATFTNLLGSILIHKVDGAGNDLAGAGFTFDPDPFTGGAAVEILDGSTDDQADDDDGWLCIDNVLLDTYDITETTVPSGFFADSAKTVTVSSASTCAERLADTATPDTTFTDKKGSLIIHKVAKNKNAEGGIAPLGGATFTITPNPLTGTGSLDITDDGTNDVFNTTAGVICIDDVWNLGAGNSYSMVEKTAPANYQKDSSTKTKEVTSPSTCADRTVSGTADATFTNVPLSKIEVIFTSLAGSGVTTATIDCKDSAEALLSFTFGVNLDLDKIFTGLVPGTYTCTIVIDP